jgi:DNA-binding CsgD family transcriptional regulator
MQKINLPTPITAEVGLILMDLSLNLIACDRGAASILNYPNRSGLPLGASNIPTELLEMLRSRKPNDSSPLKTHLRIGLSEYVCRAYFVEGPEGMFTEPVLALHLERDLSASDAASEVGSRYNLTEREMEALKGILVGLGSKEVAERMNISPNTVKAFLRLIMIKMGVTTRAGIVAKVLQNRATPEEREAAAAAGAAPASPAATPRPKRKEAAAAHGVNTRNAALPKAAPERWTERIGDSTGTESKLGSGTARFDLGNPKSGNPH